MKTVILMPLFDVNEPEEAVLCSYGYSGPFGGDAKLTNSFHQLQRGRGYYRTKLE